MGSTAMPILAMNFRVQIDGITVGAFREVTGLSGDTTVVEYRDGSDAFRSVRKGPGLQTFPNIVLKRGYTTNRFAGELYNLRDDPAQRRNRYGDEPDMVRRLKALLEKYKAEGRSTPEPPRSE